jgi:hypothetical protein
VCSLQLLTTNNAEFINRRRVSGAQAMCVAVLLTGQVCSESAVWGSEAFYAKNDGHVLLHMAVQLQLHSFAAGCRHLCECS